jgi:hypothetical protein
MGLRCFFVLELALDERFSMVALDSRVRRHPQKMWTMQ